MQVWPPTQVVLDLGRINHDRLANALNRLAFARRQPDVFL